MLHITVILSVEGMDARSGTCDKEASKIRKSQKNYTVALKSSSAVPIAPAGLPQASLLN